MDQTNADRVDAGVAEKASRRTHARFVERAQLFAQEVQPPADFAHVAQRHDAIGLHPEIRIAVALRHRLPRDLENVPEPLGDDQPETRDLALQQRIGRDRRAVRQHGEIVDARAPFAQDRVNPAHQSHRRIGRRRRHLGHPHRARFVVHTDDIGKRAAGVDADPQAGVVTHNRTLLTTHGFRYYPGKCVLAGYADASKSPGMPLGCPQTHPSFRHDRAAVFLSVRSADCRSEAR